jgi:hypothetical protein
MKEDFNNSDKPSRYTAGLRIMKAQVMEYSDNCILCDLQAFAI